MNKRIKEIVGMMEGKMPKKKKTVKRAITNRVKSEVTAVNKTKRSGIPKRVEANLGKHILNDEAQFFNLKNGRKLKSLLDLARNLERMSEDVFSYHVTPYKNDFSAWIYHSFLEVELARRLANEKNKKRTLEIIIEFFRD